MRRWLAQRIDRRQGKRMTNAWQQLSPVWNVVSRNVKQTVVGMDIPRDCTNWNSYSHQDMYNLLHTDSDPTQVGLLAGQWQTHGDGFRKHAEDITHEQGKLSSNWAGQSTQNAGTMLGGYAGEMTKAQNWAYAVHVAVQDAGTALSLAKNKMPAPSGGH